MVLNYSTVLRKPFWITLKLLILLICSQRYIYLFVRMLNLFKRVFNYKCLMIEIDVSFLNPFHTITHQNYIPEFNQWMFQ